MVKGKDISKKKFVVSVKLAFHVDEIFSIVKTQQFVFLEKFCNCITWFYIMYKLLKLSH